VFNEKIARREELTNKMTLAKIFTLQINAAYVSFFRQNLSLGG
jgi:hypothetical protein